jgi:hypothetical protein
LAASKGAGHGGPARGYSREPFKVGNKAAVRHGAQSPELVEARARELAPEVLEANSHLDVARDGAAVFRYAVTLARIERVYAWLDERDDPVFEDERAGEVHAVYSSLERWEAAASRAEQQLAIAPLTRTKLGLDRLVAFDLARYWAAQAEAEEADGHQIEGNTDADA